MAEVELLEDNYDELESVSSGCSIGNDDRIQVKLPYGVTKIYTKEGKHLKTVISSDKDRSNTDDGTYKVASCLSRKTVEFINGKRKISLRDISIGARKAGLIRALIESKGVVAPALKAAGVSYSCFKRYIKNDPEFADNVRYAKEVALDFAETRLFDNIDLGKEQSLIYYLRTQGKKRGYGDDKAGSGSTTIINQNADIEDLTDDEIRQRIEQLDRATKAAE